MVEKISKKSVFIIDGSSFLYRSYYAMKPLYTSGGQPVQAVYGFCRMIKKIIEVLAIEHIVIVWDSKGKTWRHELYQNYKATRQAPPSDIFEQKALIQEFAELVGIMQLSQIGQEADDLMYSLAQVVVGQGYQAVLVSSDKDMRQVLQDQIIIFDPFKEAVLDEHDCSERYGFEVAKLPFYFAILGDSSDNIPGVKGIGEKGATELVKQFENLDDLYAHIEQIAKQRMQELLLQQKDNAYLSHRLFLLQTVDVALSVEQAKIFASSWVQAIELFKKLEFKSLVKEIEKKHGYPVLSSDEAIKPAQETVALHEKYNFVLINKVEQLVDLCDQLKRCKSFALDTETSGLDPMQSRLIGISIAYQVGQAFYIPLAHNVQQTIMSTSQEEVLQLSVEIVLQYLGPILKDVAVEKCMHNAKFDQLVLLQAGFEVCGTIFDTMIASCLISKEWEKNGLKDLSERLFQETMVSYKDLIKLFKTEDFSQIPLDMATKYSAADAHQTLKLVSIFKEELKKSELQDLFYSIELPTNSILVEMQQEGIFCDKNILNRLGILVGNELRQIEEKIYDIAGKQINLNSPKQMRELLFEQLKLTPKKKSGKANTLSTDAEVLKALEHEHEVVKWLLVYRELFKLKSTYIDALPTYINPKTQKIHTSWNQTVAATGRLSSSSPNLQNIPRENLRYLHEDIDVRSAFIAQEGWVFISADYSQIELRVLAQLSKDKHLIQAFLSNVDIHAQTASGLFGVAIDQVTKDQRAVGKRINFSVLYGLTAYGLSKDMSIAYADAKKCIWMEQSIEFVKKHGYTRTMYGRRRDIPGIYEKNKGLFELAKRIAINTPVQGTAAEITKLGMIAFDRICKNQVLNAQMVLQIHDELLVTCPKEIERAVSMALRHALVEVVSWDIPLEVSIRTGCSWQDVTK